MAYDLWFALWFFLPAGVANVTPILLLKVPVIKHWNRPFDLGWKLRGRRLLGDHKTWRGIIGGSLTAIFCVYLQAALFNHSEFIHSISQPVNYEDISLLGLGLALGFGALSGDALKSIVKRQIGVKPGSSWFPFDQLDYIIGGLLLSSLFVDLPLNLCLTIAGVWFVMHLIFSYFGYLLKFKDTPI